MPEPYLFDRLLELTLLLQQDLARSLDGVGLTPARAHLLWELDQLGPASQHVLAKALQVSPRNVTGLVDALEGHGYVQRSPHPSDRRALVVTLTDKGEQTVAQMQADRVSAERELVEGIDAAEIEQLIRGLDTVLGRLRHMVEDAASP